MKIQKPIIAPPVSSKKIWDTISLAKRGWGRFSNADVKSFLRCLITERSVVENNLEKDVEV